MRILSFIGSSLAMLAFCFLTLTLMPAEVRANNHERCETTSSGATECTEILTDGEIVAIAAGAVTVVVVVVVAFGAWLFSSDSDDADDADDKKKSFQFKELEAEGYMPARSWFGLKQNLTESVQVSLGGFWLKDNSINSIATLIPSHANLGTDFSMAYATPRFGSLTLTGAMYSRGDDQNSSFEVHHSVGEAESEWDMVASLRWRKRW